MKENRLSRQIHFNITEKEYQTIKRISESYGMKINEYILWRLNGVDGIIFTTRYRRTIPKVKTYVNVKEILGDDKCQQQ